MNYSKLLEGKSKTQVMDIYCNWCDRLEKIYEMKLEHPCSGRIKEVYIELYNRIEKLISYL